MSKSCIYLLILLLPILATSQDSLPSMPFKNGAIEFERIFNIDSSKNKEQLFKAVKQALIRNTNYKYAKIDEDFQSGNISATINYSFSAKPGIAKILYNAESLISIDVRDNRFRVKVLNSSYKIMVVGETISSTIEKAYEFERGRIEQEKWKPERSVIIPWTNTINSLIEAFGKLIALQSNDDF